MKCQPSVLSKDAARRSLSPNGSDACDEGTPRNGGSSEKQELLAQAMAVFFFDIDGTLLDSGGAGREAMYRAVERLYGVARSPKRVPFAGRTDRAIACDLLAVHRIAPDDEAIERFFGQYVRCLPETLQESNRARVLPGVEQALQTVAQWDHVHLGLLTGNIRDGARTKLGHFGLADFFRFGGFGDRYLDRDDVAREALQAASQYLGKPVDPRDCWVIGDTPLDVRCARAVGAHAVGVLTGWSSRESLQAAQPDLLLESLEDLDVLLQAAGLI
jgi:phosphoglycolate phosphatase